MAVTNLMMVVQAALPDLKAQKNGAILVINGGLGYFDAKLDAGLVVLAPLLELDLTGSSEHLETEHPNWATFPVS